MSIDLPVAELSMDDAKAELDRLHAVIEAADRAYYQDDAPDISDPEYDAARRRDQELEPKFRQPRAGRTTSIRATPRPGRSARRTRLSPPSAI